MRYDHWCISDERCVSKETLLLRSNKLSDKEGGGKPEGLPMDMELWGFARCWHSSFRLGGWWIQHSTNIRNSWQFDHLGVWKNITNQDCGGRPKPNIRRSSLLDSVSVRWSFVSALLVEIETFLDFEGPCNSGVSKHSQPGSRHPLRYNGESW